MKVLCPQDACQCQHNIWFAENEASVSPIIMRVHLTISTTSQKQHWSWLRCFGGGSGLDGSTATIILRTDYIAKGLADPLFWPHCIGSFSSNMAHQTDFSLRCLAVPQAAFLAGHYWPLCTLEGGWSGPASRVCCVPVHSYSNVHNLQAPAINPNHLKCTHSSKLTTKKTVVHICASSCICFRTYLKAILELQRTTERVETRAFSMALNWLCAPAKIRTEIMVILNRLHRGEEDMH